MIIAAITGLLLNMCWNPLIDLVTGGKYGEINTNTIFLLSLCLPFLYLMNFFWTIYFVQNRLKTILYIFLITFGVNVIGDLILIPFFKNEGAAVAFLASCIIQAVLFTAKNKVGELNNALFTLAKCILCALISGMLSKILFHNLLITIVISVVFYFLLLFLTRQISSGDRKYFSKIWNWWNNKYSRFTQATNPIFGS